MRETVRFARIAVIAALYAALTVAIAPIGYNAIQFRLTEILVLLCFYRKDYCYSLILGCFIANWFSPMGYIDVIFGTLSTVFSVVTMRYIKNFYIAAFMPTVSMVFVAFELWMFAGEPFWISLGTTMLGEFVVVSVIGVIVFKILEKNRAFMTLIGSEIVKLKLSDAIHNDGKAIDTPSSSNDADVTEIPQSANGKNASLSIDENSAVVTEYPQSGYGESFIQSTDENITVVNESMQTGQGDKFSQSINENSGEITVCPQLRETFMQSTDENVTVVKECLQAGYGETDNQSDDE